MVRFLRLAGLLLFAAAFALPAVRIQSAGAPPSTQVGWVCALFATAATGSLAHPGDAGALNAEAGVTLPLAISGWVNPLFPLYLLLCFWRKTLSARRVLAVAILLCFAASWFLFAQVGIHPLIGHFLWVAGPVVAIAPDFACARPKMKPRSEEI
jgi:hypothetical protein